MTDWLSGRPELASQFDTEKNHPLRPEDVPAGSNKKFWWKCASGHSCSRRLTRGHGEVMVAPTARAVSRFPGLMTSQLCFQNWQRSGTRTIPLQQNEVKPYVNRTAWWIGKCGHEFETSIAGRTKKQQGCPYCSGRRVRRDSTTSPLLILIWRKSGVPRTAVPRRNSLKALVSRFGGDA
jgi:hypothetical protein